MSFFVVIFLTVAATLGVGKLYYYFQGKSLERKYKQHLGVPLQNLSEQELHSLLEQSYKYPQELSLIRYYQARLFARLSAIESDEVFSNHFFYSSSSQLLLSFWFYSNLKSFDSKDTCEKINEIRKLRNSNQKSDDFRMQDKLELAYMVLTKELTPHHPMYNLAKRIINENRLTNIGCKAS